MAYAATTEVSVSKTKGEIDAMLRKTGATGFGTFESVGNAMIVFELKERRIKFVLPLPKRDDPKFARDGRGRARTADRRLEAWEQACRSKWRALYLCIKAKLESVDAGIETHEQAFLAHVVMPDGQTVGEHVSPIIKQTYLTQQMVPLLPAPRSA